MKLSTESMGLAALIVAIAFFALLLGVFSEWNLSKAGSIVVVVQGIATVAAIALGGVFAYRRLNVFRTFYPHLTISHEVSHRFIGDSYVHISVTAILRNNSNVKVDVQDAFFRLEQVAPVSDADAASYHTEVFVERKYDHVQWAVLDEIALDWKRNELIIEPGESHRVTRDFIVSKEIEAVLVYTYFFNPGYSERSDSSEGWEAITAYDVERRV